MQRKVIRLTPDDLGYKDRGMMKWLGLMLSDHTESIKQMNERDKRLDPAPKELMSQVEISTMLQEAYTKKLPILVQANIIRNGLYYPDLQCIVLGFHDDKIYLRLKDGRTCQCEMTQIRNIEYMDSLAWYEKK